METLSEKRYLTTDELAARLGQPKDYIRRVIIKGRRIPFFKPSPRKTLFAEANVVEFERKMTVGAIA